MSAKDAIRLGLFAAVAAANAALAQWGAGAPAAPVAGAVRMGALATLWAAAYLGLASLWRGRGRPKELPRLSLESVAVYAYGGGLLAFVTAYTALALHTGASMAYLLTVAGLCMGDAIEREADPCPRRLCVLAGAGLSVAAGLVAAYAEDDLWALAAAAAGDGDWPELAYGLVLPLAAPFLHHFTRDRRYYAPGAVAEFVQLAMPFAAVAALVALATLPPPPPPPAGAPGANATDCDYLLALASGIRRDQFAEALLPLTTLPVLFFVTQSALLYSAADWAAILAALTAAKHWAARPAEPHAALALVLAAAGAALRLGADAECLAARPAAAYDAAALTADLDPDIHCDPEA